MKLTTKRATTGDDVKDAFRNLYGQSQTASKPVEKPNRRVKQDSEYSKFLQKYENIEKTFETFTTKDLMFFFREKAKESGVKYVIANMTRDMGIFKKLQSNFEVSEILLMIEFIFSGDQTYLDINRTQPTVLVSGWVNTIYQDSILWANDEYIDKKSIGKSDAKRVSNREWHKSENTVKIGEWE